MKHKANNEQRLDRVSVSVLNIYMIKTTTTKIINRFLKTRHKIIFIKKKKKKMKLKCLMFHVCSNLSLLQLTD